MTIKRLHVISISLVVSMIVTTSGFAATINAKSCLRADVQTAISTASVGDTVVVPSGSCTWTSSIDLTKKVNVIGSGIDSTNLNCSGRSCFTSSTNGVRISGFTFSNIDQAILIYGTGWRIDHCKFTDTTHKTGVQVAGMVDNNQPSGVIDHCIFNYCNVVNYGTAAMLTEGNYQHNLWAQDPGFGNVSAVYIEDNTFSNGTNSVDCNYGGRYVFRFNTVKNSYLEAHSVQGDNRACQRWEIYNNTITDPTWVSMFIRGGSGFIFNNTTNSASQGQVAFNNVRTCESREVCGQCNGTSNWDENTAGQYGYACRDQIGRAKDNAQWAPGKAYDQPLYPAYLWSNTVTPTGAQMGTGIHDAYGCSGVAFHILANRDFYTEVSPFSGTTGVGAGTLANRPSSCTAGVGYWATDQGTWNQTGNDGVLYKCTATNTWTAHYTPYTYPHPLQEVGGGDTTAPTVSITNSDPSSITSDSLSVIGTASDAMGVTSCKYRIGSAPDASNGTACTCDDGTCDETSEAVTCSTSGYSRGG